jgi:hypothetical protein
VTLDVFDVRGKHLSTIVDGTREAQGPGPLYGMPLQLQAASTFYRVEATAMDGAVFRATKKMVVVT